jgi:hypothetical protein
VKKIIIIITLLSSVEDYEQGNCQDICDDIRFTSENVTLYISNLFMKMASIY